MPTDPDLLEQLQHTINARRPGGRGLSGGASFAAAREGKAHQELDYFVASKTHGFSSAQGTGPAPRHFLIVEPDLALDRADHIWLDGEDPDVGNGHTIVSLQELPDGETTDVHHYEVAIT